MGSDVRTGNVISVPGSEGFDEQDYFLAFDRGGTTTKGALLQGVVGEPCLRVVLYQECDTWQTPVLEGAMQQFWESAGAPRLRSACFGVAGEVVNGICRNPKNLPSDVSAESLSSVLGCRVKLLNDSVANADGLAGLEPEHLFCLWPGKFDGPNNKVISNAGTGLGASFIPYNTDTCSYSVVATEASHMRLPDEAGGLTQFKDWLHKERQVLTYDDLICGQGFVRSLQYVIDWIVRGEEQTVARATFMPLIEAIDPSLPAKITQMALEGTSRACAEALYQVAGWWGLFHRETFFNFLPYGGIYLAGGIIDKLTKHEAFMDKFGRHFLSAFHSWGDYTEQRQATPVHVVRYSHLGWHGAAINAVKMTKANRKS